MAGDIYFFVPNKEFEKSVRFVREHSAIHHSINSLHGKKRRREGLYSFDLRNALDILMPHHFMGRVFQRGGHNRNPPSGISSRWGRVSGTL